MLFYCGYTKLFYPQLHTRIYSNFTLFLHKLNVMETFTDKSFSLWKNRVENIFIFSGSKNLYTYHGQLFISSHMWIDCLLEFSCVFRILNETKWKFFPLLIIKSVSPALVYAIEFSVVFFSYRQIRLYFQFKINCISISNKVENNFNCSWAPIIPEIVIQFKWEKKTFILFNYLFVQEILIKIPANMIINILCTSVSLALYHTVFFFRILFLYFFN